MIRLALALLVLFSILGCEQRMARQPRFRVYGPSSFFPDGTSARPRPAGTVAHASPEPRPPRSSRLLARGRDRHEIYCVTCHGSEGTGNGPVTRVGLPSPPDYRAAKSRTDEELFSVLTRGKGGMFGFSSLLSTPDRWAIVEHIRKLQSHRRPDAHTGGHP